MTYGLVDTIRPQIFVRNMIGTKLAHYEITSHLGSGGLGDVYQGTDAKLGRGAIKLVRVPGAERGTLSTFAHLLERVLLVA